MELDKSKLLPNYYYKVKHRGEWRLGYARTDGKNNYFYILDCGINYNSYDTEELYPIFRIDKKTGEVFDEGTDCSFFDRK